MATSPQPGAEFSLPLQWVGLILVSDERERFVSTDQLKAGVSRPEAERAARATLERLAERLSAVEARP